MILHHVIIFSNVLLTSWQDAPSCLANYDANRSKTSGGSGERSDSDSSLAVFAFPTRNLPYHTYIILLYWGLGSGCWCYHLPIQRWYCCVRNYLTTLSSRSSNTHIDKWVRVVVSTTVPLQRRSLNLPTWASYNKSYLCTIPLYHLLLIDLWTNVLYHHVEHPW
jgi:hypothetical protein